MAHCGGNPSQYAATKPTQRDLKVVVADHAGNNWSRLLTNLDIPWATIERIKAESSTNLSEVCMKGLLIWSKGGASDSNEPVTFGTLFAALKDSGMADCVSLLVDSLDERSTPHPKPTHEYKDEDLSTPTSERGKELTVTNELLQDMRVQQSKVIEELELLRREQDQAKKDNLDQGSLVGSEKEKDTVILLQEKHTQLQEKDTQIAKLLEENQRLKLSSPASSSSPAKPFKPVQNKPLSHGVDSPTEHLSAEQDTLPSEQPPDQPKYRFVIMVANANELHATMHFLGSKKRWTAKETEDSVLRCTYEGDENLKNKIKPPQKKINGTYGLAFFPFTVCGIRGVVVKCGTKGSFSPMGSHHTTLQLMKEATGDDWELKTIFIVGCCATRPEIEENEQGVSESPSPEKAKRIVSKPAVTDAKSVPIGTVLVAEEIFQYARLVKLKDGSIEWIPLCCSPPLSVDLDAVQYGDEGSDGYRIVKRVERATFLSGDFVVKGKDIASELGKLQSRPYVGFEMEGVGVTKAIDDAQIFVPNKPPKVVLVKGVSDKAGWDKNKPCAIQFFSEILQPEQKVKEDSRQQMCTIMSLTLVLKYIIQNKAIYTK